MSNDEFKREYGIYEYYALNKRAYEILAIWQMNRTIKGFKCHNKNKKATIYLDGGKSKCVDYAQIVTNKNILK